MVKNPKEITKIMIFTSKHKIERNILITIMLSILAGLFIAFGALGNILAGATIFKTNKSLAMLLGSAVFPVGLMMVVIMGCDLFTSSIMNMIPVFTKETKISKFFLNISVVFLFNFVGAIILAAITYKTGILSSGEFNQYLNSIVSHKVQASWFSIFLKGIMCNILVCGAVLLSYSSDNVIGKIFAIWFPIMVFILLGYDHSVANMFYLSVGYYHSSVRNIGLLTKNMLMSTLGNIVGGILISGIMYLSYGEKMSIFWDKLKNKKKENKNSNTSNENTRIILENNKENEK